MNSEYYRLALNIRPTYCEPITYTVTIKEPFEKFMKRQTTDTQCATLILCVPCSKEEYELYKKYNPPSGSYIK